MPGTPDRRRRTGVIDGRNGARRYCRQPPRGLMRHPVCHLETEQEYFHRLDVELIDGMRRHAALEEKHRRMAEACQLQNHRILDALDHLGYDPTTVTLLYLVPLVQVAWSDGAIDKAERNRIEVIASLCGIRDNSSAYQQLMVWLDQRPSFEFFEGTLRVIQEVLETQSESKRKTNRDLIIQCCRDVAFASCGLFGWKSKICLAKRKLVREIIRRLEPKQPASAAAATAGE